MRDEDKSKAQLLAEISELKAKLTAISQPKEGSAEDRIFRDLFDDAPIGMAVIDQNLCVVNANERLADLFAMALPHLKGLPCGDIIRCVNRTSDPSGCGHTEHCPSCGFYEGLQKVFNTGKSIHDREVKRLIETPDGRQTERWFHINIKPMHRAETVYAILSIDDITERRRLIDSLHKSEEWYRTLLDTQPDPILIYDLEGNLLSASRQSFELHGLKSLEEFKARFKHLSEFFPPEMKPKLKERLEALKKMPRGDRAEYELILSDGEKALVETHTAMLHNHKKEPIAFITVIRDMTERRRNEKKLRINEERLKFALNATEDGLSDWDLKTKTAYFSPRYYTMLGYEPDEFPATLEYLLTLIHPDDVAKASATLRKHIESSTGKPFSNEFRMRAKDGQWRWILARGRVVEFDADGNPARLVGIHADINDRKMAEQALQINEERLNFALNATNDGLWDWDIATGETYFNAAYFRMLGYEPGELPSSFDVWEALLHPEDKRSTLAAIDAHLNNQSTDYQVEFRLRTKDNHWKWILARGKVVARDKEGLPTRMAGTHTDISERKLAEEALRQSEEKFRALVESSADWIWEVDNQGLYTYSSPQVKSMLGLETEEVIGKSPFDLMPPEEAERVLEVFKACVDEKKPIEGLKNLNVHKDGHLVMLETNGVPIFDEHGNVSCYRGMDRDITERERILAEKEQLSEIIENTSDLVSMAYPDGRLRYLNPAGCELVDWDAKNDIEKHAIPELHPEWALDIIQNIGLPHAAEHGIWEGETALRHRDGHEIPVSQVIIRHRSPSGTIEYMSTIMRDISEEKQAEERLKDSERRLKALFNQSYQLMGLLDRDGRLLDANNIALGMIGMELSDVYGKFFWETPWWSHDPELQNTLRDAIRRAADGEAVQFYADHMNFNRRLRTIDFSISPVADAEGNIVYLVPEGHDITEMVDAQKSADEQLKKYQALFENANDAICLMSNYTIIECNQKTLETFGASSREQIVGIAPDHLSPETQPDGSSSAQTSLKRMDDALTGGRQFFEWRHKRLDGSEFDAEISLSRVDFGMENAILAIIRDITQRKQTEHELRYRSRFEKMIGQISTDFINVAADKIDEQIEICLKRVTQFTDAKDGYILLFTPDQRYLSLSHIWKSESDSLLSNNLSQADVSDLKWWTDKLLAGKTVVVPSVRDLPPDAKIVKEIALANNARAFITIPLSFQDRVIGVVGFDSGISPRTWTEDEITQLKLVGQVLTNALIRKWSELDKANMEMQLRHQQKLESIGTLAGGVAHEINNPIGIIINYAQLISDDVPPDSRAFQDAKMIGKEGERIAEIVKNLLAFSRQEKESHSPAYLKDIVDSTLLLVNKILSKSNIEVISEVEENLPKLKCRSQQIMQVLMNLITNARDALDERYPQTDPKKQIEISVSMHTRDGKKWQRISVRDFGGGINETVRDKIFDPFFTTKSRHKGTGLGLSVSHGIIREHDGNLWVENIPGDGACFIIELPAENGWILE